MDVERELQEMMGKKVKDHLEPGTKLMDAGLDSLDVMELAFDIEDRFKVQLPQIGTELISFTYGDLSTCAVWWRSSWRPRRRALSRHRPEACL